MPVVYGDTVSTLPKGTVALKCCIRKAITYPQFSPKFNSLTIEDISKHSTLKFVYRHQHNLLPEIFNDIYTQTTNVHQHKTRQSKGLHVTWPDNKYGKSRKHYKGTIHWNLLAVSIISAKTMNTLFKKK